MLKTNKLGLMTLKFLLSVSVPCLLLVVLSTNFLWQFYQDYKHKQKLFCFITCIFLKHHGCEGNRWAQPRYRLNFGINVQIIYPIELWGELLCFWHCLTHFQGLFQFRVIWIREWWNLSKEASILDVGR